VSCTDDAKRLVGIITGRDLCISATADGNDPCTTPIAAYDCAPQKFHPYSQNDGNSEFSFFGFFPT
jgi:hypothetical protein